MFWTNYLRSELLVYELKRRQGLYDSTPVGKVQVAYYQRLIDDCPKSLDAVGMAGFFSAHPLLKDAITIQTTVNNQVFAYKSEDHTDVINSKTARDSQKHPEHKELVQKPFSVVKIQNRHYLLKNTLGSGVCGVAKKAVNLEDGAEVVVKIVRPVLPYLSGIALASAYNEAEILTQLARGGYLWARQLGDEWNYRNVGFSNLMRSFLVKEKIYTVQDLIPGKSLDRVLDTYDKNVSLNEISLLLLAVTKSLYILHKHDIFHGDIKLENIIFDGNLVHFIDFGLSCNTDVSGMVGANANIIMHNAPYALLQERQTVGFYHQDSPEWKRGGTLSLKTDVYALGKTFDEMMRKLNISNPSLQSIIGSMCQEDPEDRPDVRTIIKDIGFFVSRLAQMELQRKGHPLVAAEIQQEVRSQDHPVLRKE